MPLKVPDKAKQRTYSLKSYKKHRSLCIARAKVHSIITIAANRQFLNSYLRKHPCVDCGENDIVVLEFDHVRGKKIKHVSDLVRRGCGRQTLIAEIEKCDVRCANCHRRKTAREQDWIRNGTN